MTATSDALRARLDFIRAKAAELAEMISLVVGGSDCDAVVDALVDVLSATVVTAYQPNQHELVLSQIRTLLHYRNQKLQQLSLSAPSTQPN